MAGWRHLVVVLPGIGGSVLARPGDPDDVVWDAGKGDIAGLVVRPDRMSLAEAPRLAPMGLTESTRFLGFTVVPGYEGLLAQLESTATVDRRGDPRRPLAGADVVAVPYDFRRSIVEAAERVDAVVCAHLTGYSQTERAGRVIVTNPSQTINAATAPVGLLRQRDHDVCVVNSTPPTVRALGMSVTSCSRRSTATFEMPRDDPVWTMCRCMSAVLRSGLLGGHNPF